MVSHLSFCTSLMKSYLVTAAFLVGLLYNSTLIKATCKFKEAILRIIIYENKWRAIIMTLLTLYTLNLLLVFIKV